MERKPVVLIPGLLCTGALYEAQISALAAHADFTVADHTKHSSISEIAEYILQDAPSFFNLAGLSMGGYVALEIIRQAPERVSRLVLLDTSARPDSAEQTTKRKQFLKLAEYGKFKGITRQLLPMLVHPDHLGDAALAATIFGMAAEVGREGFIRQQHAIMGRPDSRPGLARIDCPALVVVGREDQLTPVDLAEEMAGAIPNARLEVVENCGHLSTLEQPEAVSRLLRDWLL